MEEVILATAITISILLISSVSSPKLRAAIYSLPIPITILLFGTGGNVNITYLVGLLLVLTFMTVTWLLHKKLKIHIIPAIIISVALYVGLGTLNRFIVNVPFLIGYFILVVCWLIYIVKPIKLHQKHYRKVQVNLKGKDYIIRGSIIFVLAYSIIGIKGLIFGAAITFPFNGIFTVYIMREQLPVLITEQIRNFLALFTFFLIVWLLQPKLGLLAALAVGWLVVPSMIYGISHYVPRPYSSSS
ncbi:MAG TPA: hypothetical protein VFH99_02995 [Candidatus Saccharimonadales bacterium]|nr:hypothetical protein [Candidatus Saccharimonadales bacterium]